MPGLYCAYVQLDGQSFKSTNETSVNTNDNIKTFLSVDANHPEPENNALTSWSEDVSRWGFKACALATERTHPYPNITLHWAAIQKSDGGDELGTKDFAPWFTGSKCEIIHIIPVSIWRDIKDVLCNF